MGQSEEDVEPTDPGQEATELDDEGRRQHENRILDEPIRWNSLKEILPLNWESSIREEWECNFKIFVKYGFTEKCYQRSSQLWHLNLGAFPSEQNWNSHGLNYRKKMVQSLFMTGQRYGVINPHPCIHCMTMGVQCRIYNPNLRRKATATFLRRLGTSCALCRFERRRCGEEVT